MGRVNTAMPENVKAQIAEVISTVPDNGVIRFVSVNADYSIWNLLNLASVQKSFSPQLTKNNFFTYGGTFAKVTKLVNTILPCEYVTGPTVTVTRHYKYGYRVPSHITQYIGTPKEPLYFTYNVAISFAGKTPEQIEKERQYAIEKERREKEAEELRQRRISHIKYWENLHKDEIYESVGCANGWGDDTPEIVKVADADSDCFYESYSVGRCMTKYVCHKYKFYYTVDSSD